MPVGSLLHQGRGLRIGRGGKPAALLRGDVRSYRRDRNDARAFQGDRPGAAGAGWRADLRRVGGALGHRAIAQGRQGYSVPPDLLTTIN